MSAGSRHFACSQCGACCDRSPELLLSEAAAYADVFALQLMFRLYPARRASKRLRQFAVHVPQAGPALLTVSALTVDCGRGRCVALQADRRCSIHSRRPLACRTVPLHYSTADESLVDAFDQFVATSGYDCETGKDAPGLLTAGKLIEPQISDARRRAVEAASQDRDWAVAILRHVLAGDVPGLPDLAEVVANAPYGATATSMRLGWEIAAAEGILKKQIVPQLLAKQMDTIDRQLADAALDSGVRQALADLRTDYALALPVVHD